MTRPLIGVTGPDRGGDAAWWATRIALARSGARARRITPRRRVDDTDSLDGLVLGGGADVDPALYGDDDPVHLPKTETTRNRFWARAIHVVRRLRMAKERTGLDQARDEMETTLLARMLGADKPILGICRGAQLINVVLGGSLLRDLSSFYAERPNPRSVLPRKRINVEPTSRLFELVQATQLRVNALHRQAIREVAPTLVRVAVEDSGVTQAVEAPKGFVIGVQWHPEYMPQNRAQRRIFDGFVATARAQPSPSASVGTSRSKS